MKGELLNRLPLCDPDQSKQHNLQEREFGILDFLPCCLWGNITALSRRARREHPVHCAVANLARILAKRDDCCRHDFKVGGPRLSLAFSIMFFYWLAYLCHTVTLDWPACCLPDVEKVLKFTRILPLAPTPGAQHSHTF